ncbi:MULTISPECIES: lysophospholipid acyltransferase family protein [Rhodobacterales]|uniref:lysophospholipid acyltransferase family protein n=1 Tax=Rhodobacterales TaxID=204455 RepID=UPI00237F7BF2|nr:lysophospholipid acyltransferase family protein [Phaeobacter gallaeciensis]MDE4098364.1 lysophospholipid acyltransferase family protein [Phaeobacter gallaeciensis]MDE4107174.1 lysophospholipid acyltransferase family protein [Phaeobacter gallaeciensis]MDE4111874.1 lysophospholipid acyltransferase family protein [Phaeobacter gallaeciensis]MDE4116099.1 lysophospholipid acyltransferase family protein [Phaeobacter gallaeciensis]MDE4120570.1 lysophospholipid acyltransferase family protein [Phaeob
MADTAHDHDGGLKAESETGEVYDRRTLTYANSFDDRWTSLAIRAIEWFTGKLTILRMVKKFEKQNAQYRGQKFWRGALNVMGIDLLTPEEQIRNIPAEGPVVIVANHPHGMVDGMIFADLIGRIRLDYRILTRSVLTGLDEAATSFMIPVPFPHDPEAQRKMVEMRAKTMAHLKEGGVVALFPSGVVMSSDSWFGPAIEQEWNVFTAQLIRRSGARVVPIFFPGSNSRWYQIACRISPILRQGLLLHEIVRSCNKPQAPVVGEPLTDAQMERLHSDPRGFMAWLREHTLSLGSKTPADDK